MLRCIVIVLLILIPITFTTPRTRDLLKYYTNYSEDTTLFISVINSESYGQSYKEKLRSGSVILNRLKDPDFPKDICEVIFQKNQFKGINTKLFTVDSFTVKGRESIKAALYLLKYGSILPKNVVYFHNPVTGKDKRWMNKIKHRLYCKGDRHWYFTK